MILLLILLFSGCIAAIPATNFQTPPVPTIGEIEYNTLNDVACHRGNVETEIIIIDQEAGDYEIKYSLKKFAPWHDRVVPEARKYCRLNFTINMLEGWRAQVDGGGGDFEGYIGLEENTTANFKGFYRFQSTDTSSAFDELVKGPVDEIKGHTSPINNRIALSACGGAGDILTTRLMIQTSADWNATHHESAEVFKWNITTPLKIFKCEGEI